MIQWSIRLLKQNDNWTITPLSHISLMLQYYFFVQRYQLQWRKKTSHSKKKIFKVQIKRGVIKVHVRPWTAWHYKVQFLIMLQKSMRKYITFSPNHTTTSDTIIFIMVSYLCGICELMMTKNLQYCVTFVIHDGYILNVTI